MSEPVRSVAVLGRGVVAWSAAAAFAARLKGVRVTVIEDPAAPPSLADLVGTATPSIDDFHDDIRVDERALLRGVDGVFRLGARFTGWTHGAAYLHCHGEHGQVLAGAPFHQHWLRLGDEAGAFDGYSPACVLACAGRFAPPVADEASPLSRFGYGLTLNPAQYADWLRGYALHLGVACARGPGVATLDAETGRVRALALPGGGGIEADLYVDADGALADRVDARREDWSRWLPASRIAVARGPAPTEPSLVDEVTANATGWSMTIPLRAASTTLIVSANDIAGTHRFTQGRRTSPWAGNVVAIGDAALTLEPLDGLALHIAHAQVDRIVATLPDRDFAPGEIADYNRQAGDEADRLRDFLALRHALNDRPEPMWRDLAQTEPPASLAHDLRLFRARGYLPIHDGESFTPDSWLSVLIGQGVRPRRVDPVADELPRDIALARLNTMRGAIVRAAQTVPTHRQYLTRYLEGK